MAATIERRFGTDLSNVGRAVYQPKNKSKGTNAITPKVNKPKNQKKYSPVDTVDSLLREIGTNAELKTLSEVAHLIPTQQNVEEVQTKSNEFVYSRETLLALRPAFSEPIEGLIPEVLPGYFDPEVEEASSPSAASTQSPSSGKFSRTLKSDTKRNSFSSPSFIKQNKASTPVSAEEKSFTRALTIEMPASPSDSATTLRTPMKSPKGDLVDILEESLLTPTSKAEWRLKKKKEKSKETDAKRLTARQKQVDIGMNTVGYRRYLELVPIEKRSLKAPDIYQVCSKRSWDGQVRKWRRELHKYDPEGTKEEDDDLENDDDTGDAESPQNSPEINRTKEVL